MTPAIFVSRTSHAFSSNKRSRKRTDAAQQCQFWSKKLQQKLLNPWPSPCLRTDCYPEPQGRRILFVHVSSPTLALAACSVHVPVFIVAGQILFSFNTFGLAEPANMIGFHQWQFHVNSDRRPSLESNSLARFTTASATARALSTRNSATYS